MPDATPVDTSRYAPRYEVKIEGLTLAADITQAVTSLTYDNSIDTADKFTLQVNNADLQFTDNPLLNVGKDVEIYMGYGSVLEPMMLGEITAVSPSFPQNGAPTISITGYDKSHRMRHNSPERFTFKYFNDSAIAAQIAAENFLIPVVDPAPVPPKESVQQTGSDWALLKELAERNFFQVYVHWDKLYFRFPRPQTQMVTLQWGQNLSSFTPRLSTSGQFGIQIIRGYDYKLCQKIIAVLPAVSLGTDLDDIIERQGSEFIDQLVSFGRNVIRGRSVDSYVDATILAKSILKQILEGLYEGSGSCIGMPELRAGDLVNIQGLGKRFSGNYRLSKVTHTINGSGYQTRFEVTQKSTSSLLQSLRKKLIDSPSPNKQEKIHDIMTGIVKNTFGDPLRLGRVQVSFDHLSELNLSAWARVSTLMAGSMSGMYFPLDIGDEVLVQFEGGDPDRPIIIGRSWNGCKRPPVLNPDDPTERPHVIKTKGGNSITLNDTAKGEQVVIENTMGNKITFLPDGSINIEALTNLNLTAKAKITLNAPEVEITNNVTRTTISGNMITGA